MFAVVTGTPSVCRAELIEEVRRRMQGTVRKDISIQLEGLLGEGTFGKVYKGTERLQTGT